MLGTGRRKQCLRSQRMPALQWRRFPCGGLASDGKMTSPNAPDSASFCPISAWSTDRPRKSWLSKSSKWQRSLSKAKPLFHQATFPLAQVSIFQQVTAGPLSSGLWPQKHNTGASREMQKKAPHVFWGFGDHFSPHNSAFVTAELIRAMCHLGLPSCPC